MAIRKRWDYLTVLAAAGTVLMEFGWAYKFFESQQSEYRVRGSARVRGPVPGHLPDATSSDSTGSSGRPGRLCTWFSRPWPVHLFFSPTRHSLTAPGSYSASFCSRKRPARPGTAPSEDVRFLAPAAGFAAPFLLLLLLLRFFSTRYCKTAAVAKLPPTAVSSSACVLGKTKNVVGRLALRSGARFHRDRRCVSATSLPGGRARPVVDHWRGGTWIAAAPQISICASF